MTSPTKDIVDTAMAANNFTKLVSALKAADLVGTLKGEGPFTVFAPNDGAFGKLPAGTVETLLKMENKTKLAGILSLHVVAGKHMAADYSRKTSTPKSVQGEALTIEGKEGVTVNGARVVSSDIACSNGVIHIIDAVLMPHVADEAAKPGA